MGDTVRFGTRNDTVTPANSSGFNGFAYPFVTGSTGAGTANPLKMTLAQALRQWWRVRNYAVSAVTPWTLTSAGVTYTFAGGDLSVITGPSRELDFVSQGDQQWGETTTTESAGLRLILNPVVLPPNGFIPDTGTDLWPCLLIAGSISNPTGTSFVNFGNFQTSGSFSVTLDGMSFVTGYDSSGVLPGDTFTVGDLAFDAIEYWKYAQLIDGQPVFDTTTGDVIPGRSPTA